MTVTAGGIEGPRALRCKFPLLRAYVLILYGNIRVFLWLRLSHEPSGG